MSSRERWTVYPLLFLALGIALKDKVTKNIATDHVSCKSLYVTDRQGIPQVQVGLNPSGGLIRIDGQGGPRVLVGQLDQSAGVFLSDERGNLLRPPFAVRRPPPRAQQPAQPDGAPQPDNPPPDQPGEPSNAEESEP
jgi:hypothetical protein